MEVWTHRRSLWNGGGIDQGISGSCEIIADHSHALIESLIDMRKLLSCDRFGRPRVDSFGRSGFELQSFDHSRVDDAYLLGSASYDRQSTKTTTTTTNNDDDDGGGRFGWSVILVKSVDDIGRCGKIGLGVGKSSHVQVIVEVLKEMS